MRQKVINCAMDPFLGVEAFVAAAEEGSFRKGAERLGLSGAAISKSVARLEEALSVRLFDRTTRHVALTREGEIYLLHCQRALSELFEARERVEQAHRLCVGELVVALSFVLGASLSARLGAFSDLYPGLSIRLVFGDRPSRLVDDQIDVALRIGKLTQTRDIVLQLGQLRWATVASPAYLERRGHPAVPSDLSDHECLGYRNPQGHDVNWTFLTRPESKDVVALDFKKRLLTDDGRVLVDAARGGLGVAQVFYELVSDDLKRGSLALLLPEFAAPGPPLSALCKPGHQKTPKVRAFFDFLRSQYPKTAPWSGFY